MIRRAFTMRLKPDSLAEYKHHHDHVWPDLVTEIERSGIAQITTFQRGLDLFLFSQINDPKAWDKLWTSEVHRRWAELMEPLMHLRDDGIVDAGELTEIFHLQVPAGPGSSRKAPSKTVKMAAKKPAAKAEKLPVKAGKKSAKPAAKKSAKKKPAGKPKVAARKKR